MAESRPLVVTPRKDVPDCYTVQGGREIYHVDFKAMSCDCPAGWPGACAASNCENIALASNATAAPVITLL